LLLYRDERSRGASGTTYQIHIQKLNVLVIACANNLAMIASLSGGLTHTKTFNFLMWIWLVVATRRLCSSISKSKRLRRFTCLVF